VFERFDEKARRVIFHARHHASRFGIPYIEAEHMLLGLLAEDKALAERLEAAQGSPQSLINELQERTGERHGISTSVDLPLSPDVRRALAYAAEESETLRHETIECGHLILGLLRVESFASTFLRRHGIDYPEYREIVAAAHVPSGPAEPIERVEEWEGNEETAASPSLAASIAALKREVVAAVKHFDTYSDEYGEQRLKRKPWSRKEALGHLVNLAGAHHQWVARALAGQRVAPEGYPLEEWVDAQGYQTYSWRSLVDLWIGMNELLTHVLAAVPEDKAELPCRIGIEEPMTMRRVIERYVKETEDVVGQIVARL
jgi:hypothetical protein